MASGRSPGPAGGPVLPDRGAIGRGPRVLKRAGFADATHLQGGITAWAHQVDPTMPGSLESESPKARVRRAGGPGRRPASGPAARPRLNAGAARGRPVGTSWRAAASAPLRLIGPAVEQVLVGAATPVHPPRRTAAAQGCRTPVGDEVGDAGCRGTANRTVPNRLPCTICDGEVVMRRSPANVLSALGWRCVVGESAQSIPAARCARRLSRRGRRR